MLPRVPALGRTLAALFLAAPLLPATQEPFLNYTLRVDPTDLSSVHITLQVSNAPRTFHLAMATHFLTKSNNARKVEDLRIAEGSVERAEDPLWEVTVPGAEATIRYRIRVAPGTRRPDAAEPFLVSSGGLLGDLHMFLYVVESPRAPAHVALQLPPGWKTATSLAPTSDEGVFYARSAEELSDSPILSGNLHEHRFQVQGAPVLVAYWPAPDAKPFDEAALAGSIEKIVRGATALFGGPPWREYVFQIRDGAEGALEHADCVTVGVSSAELAANAHAADGQIAHELFHAWNMMRIRSAEYGGIDYGPVMLSGLWLSEGATMFYSDLLRRRAGLPMEEATRIAHLEKLIPDYLTLQGYSLFSAEQISLAAFNPARPMWGIGNYIGFPQGQGELLTAMLDLVIRDATSGQRSMDDLMRAMFAEHSGERGFTTRDVERVAAAVCGCNVTGFFDAYVRGASGIDFNRYLQLAGLRMEVEWSKTVDGKALDDRGRIYAWMAPGEKVPRIQLINGDDAWGRASLQTGDQVVKINGSPVESADGLRKALDAFHTGDTFQIEFLRNGSIRQAAVKIGPVERPVVRIRELPDATARQRAVFHGWSKGE